MGFEHLKLRFRYDQVGARDKVTAMAQQISEGKELLFVEGGKDIEYGLSFFLNVLSVAEYLGGRLVILVGGDDNYIVDNVIFIKKYLSFSGIDFCGVIINKVHNVEDFSTVYLPMLEKSGVSVLGVIPYVEQLTFFSMDYLAQYLLARVVAGENQLTRRINHIYVGAASVDSVYCDPLFHMENKLVITSGDRSDMLLASFEDPGTSAVVLTNNILPPPNLLAKAEEKKIPVLLVPKGVYEIARQIEALTPLVTVDNEAEIDLMEKLVRENINLQALLGE